MRSKPWDFFKSDEEMQAEQEQRRRREDADYELPSSESDVTGLEALLGSEKLTDSSSNEVQGAIGEKFVEQVEEAEEVANNDALLGLSIDELNQLLATNTSTIGSNKERIFDLESEVIKTVRENIITQFHTIKEQEGHLKKLEDIVGYESQRTFEKKKEKASEDSEYRQIMNPDFEEHLNNMDKVRLDRDKLFIRREDLKKIIKLRELRRTEDKEGLYDFLENLQDDELFDLEARNSEEISANQEEIKSLEQKAKETLIRRIQEQQQTLAEQQKQIAKLEAKGNDK